MVSYISNSLFNAIYDAPNAPDILVPEKIIPATIEIEMNKPYIQLTKEINETDCSITSTLLNDLEVRSKLPCNHHYSYVPLIKWLNQPTGEAAPKVKKENCPLCRAPSKPENVQAYITAEKINTLDMFIHLREPKLSFDEAIKVLERQKEEQDKLEKEKANKTNQTQHKVNTVEADSKQNRASQADSKQNSASFTPTGDPKLIGYPIKFIPEQKIEAHTLYKPYTMKPCLARIVKTIPFKAVAITFNIAHIISAIALDILMTFYLISIEGSLLLCIKIAESISRFVFTTIATPFIIPAFIYALIKGIDRAVNICNTIEYLAHAPIHFFIKYPIEKITFVFRHILANVACILSSKLTPKSIWNDGLLEFPRGVKDESQEAISSFVAESFLSDEPVEDE